MSDRELLELAAKAAGLDDAEWRDMNGWGEIRHGFANAMWSSQLFEVFDTGYWNPLVDDGQALRLAVKLRLTTDTSDGMLDGNKYTPATRIDASSGRMLLIELHGADPYAATRRAIVRAAAEIGRTL